jgi:hypothetical protein
MQCIISDNMQCFNIDGPFRSHESLNFTFEGFMYGPLFYTVISLSEFRSKVYKCILDLGRSFHVIVIDARTFHGCNLIFLLG